MDEELLRRAKRHAAKHHRTFTQLIEDAVRDLLRRQKDERPRARVELPVSTVHGPKISEEQFRRMMEDAEADEAARFVQPGAARDPS
jgi:hypothetical protein